MQGQCIAGYDYGRTPDLSKSGPLIQSLVLTLEQPDVNSLVSSNIIMSGPSRRSDLLDQAAIFMIE
jgi:hypothetical protein